MVNRCRQPVTCFLQQPSCRVRSSCSATAAAKTGLRHSHAHPLCPHLGGGGSHPFAPEPVLGEAGLHTRGNQWVVSEHGAPVCRQLYTAAAGDGLPHTAEAASTACAAGHRAGKPTFLRSRECAPLAQGCPWIPHNTASTTGSTSSIAAQRQLKLEAGYSRGCAPRGCPWSPAGRR